MDPAPTLDLDALSDLLGGGMREGFAQLEQLYREIDTKNAAYTEELDLPCHRGCDACCHESVFLTPLEFFYVWDYVQRELDDATRTHIVEEGLALYQTHRDVIEAFNRPPPGGDPDHLRLARTLRYRCPLLGPEGQCRVYPVRELYARMFGCSLMGPGSLYACDLVGKHLDGQVVTLPRVRPVAERLDELPLTGFRQVYPYYIQRFYGASEP